MYEYIIGTVTELNPAEVVIDNSDIGYKVQITLQTFDKIKGAKKVKLYIWHLVREDDEALYGFFDKEERYLFTLLISVSGIGPNTARVILSSLTSEELTLAVATGDVNKLKGVKGIGLKTAQKAIIELKDKINKKSADESIPGLSSNDSLMNEAATALTTLGFSKSSIEKVLSSILKQEPNCPLELLIKKSLKLL